MPRRAISLPPLPTIHCTGSVPRAAGPPAPPPLYPQRGGAWRAAPPAGSAHASLLCSLPLQPVSLCATPFAPTPQLPVPAVILFLLLPLPRPALSPAPSCLYAGTGCLRRPQPRLSCACDPSFSVCLLCLRSPLPPWRRPLPPAAPRRTVKQPPPHRCSCCVVGAAGEWRARATGGEAGAAAEQQAAGERGSRSRAKRVGKSGHPRRSWLMSSVSSLRSPSCRFASASRLQGGRGGRGRGRHSVSRAEAQQRTHWLLAACRVASTGRDANRCGPRVRPRAERVHACCASGDRTEREKSCR